MTMMLRALLLTLTASLALGACNEFSLRAPAGFVELESDRYDYQAVDAAGVVFALRSLDAHSASASFWEEAVSAQLQRLGAYEKVAEHPITSADGTPGKRFVFERRQGNTLHIYSVSMLLVHDSIAFIDRSRLFVVETGGEASAHEKREQELAKTIAELDLDLPL